jgi:hypothetical protein
VKRLSDQTLYEIIEISPDALPEEIARACDRAAATYGEGSLATYTLASPEETALLVSRIEEARSVLLDPGARVRYDERIGVRPPSPPPGPEADTPQRTDPPPAAATPWPPLVTEPAVAAARPLAPGLPAGPPAGPRAEPAPPAWTEPSAVPEAAVLASVHPFAPTAATGRPPVADGPPPPIPLTTAVAAPPQVPPIPLLRTVAPILLDRQVAPPQAVTVPEGAAWSGDMLRQVRESRGLTVNELAQRTRITRHHLLNVEQDRFGDLPAPVYLRGIIMSLARELRLDGQKVARSYLDRMAPSTGDPARRDRDPAEP